MYKIKLGTSNEDETIYQTKSFDKATHFFENEEYTNFNNELISMSIFQNKEILKTKN